jgi:pyruvate/2-oxoglutarate dehydrogenase complex dihydrolipoamide acyltransferase (E2) component
VALVAVEIPRVGLVMENARLVRWLKNVGDVVRQGEPLLELETEKSTVEIESSESGRLVEILLHADQEARVGDRIAWIDSDTERLGADMTHPVETSTLDASATRPPLASIASEHTRATALVNKERAPRRIRSSPVARRLAAQHGVDLGRLAGTGAGGRVQLSDVKRAIEARSAQPATGCPASGPQPLSSLRRALARAMTLSSTTVPQFVVERAVDWTALQARRAKLVAELPAGAARL